jgi:hypothetical protein
LNLLDTAKMPIVGSELFIADASCGVARNGGDGIRVRGHGARDSRWQIQDSGWAR